MPKTGSDLKPRPEKDEFREVLALGDQQVPGAWRYMFPENLAEMRFPSECQSTCGNCPKVKEEGFHPDYRCCTYHPTVPNFLLGFALEDPLTAPPIERLIEERMGTPEGLVPTSVQLRESLEFKASGSFAHPGKVVCRFLDVENRRCGIYKYRNSICTTFFCKHDHADEGHDFWSKLQGAAGVYEGALAQWAMAELELAPAAYFARYDQLGAQLTAQQEPPDGSWAAASLQTLWGSWYGREKDFYLACSALVRRHKDDLPEIISKQRILSPKLYEQAFIDSLPGPMRGEMNGTGLTGGEPVDAADLWYMFKLTHRNLWLPRDADLD